MWLRQFKTKSFYVYSRNDSFRLILCWTFCHLSRLYQLFIPLEIIEYKRIFVFAGITLQRGRTGKATGASAGARRESEETRKRTGRSRNGIARPRAEHNDHAKYADAEKTKRPSQQNQIEGE